MSIPTVTICIRTFSGRYNGKLYDRVGFLRRNMASLFANTKIDHKIVIIDDASTLPEQHKALAEYAKVPNVEVIVKPKNLGRQHSFAMQRRIGLKSKSPYVYICDDDYEYQSGWLGRLVYGYDLLRKTYSHAEVGLLSGFHRDGFKPDYTHKCLGCVCGSTKKWLGCRWLMGRDVLLAGGYLDLAPTPDWPAVWTSPWIDDGSYQMQLTSERGYSDAFVMMESPSLVEHIGTFGVHSRPSKHVWGTK